MPPDLFGAPDPPPPSKAKRKPTPAKGHAFRPGTGPEGETCGSCAHLARKTMAKTYLKCGLNRAAWTGGGGSDVRARDPACKFWSVARGLHVWRYMFSETWENCFVCGIVRRADDRNAPCKGPPRMEARQSASPCLALSRAGRRARHSGPPDHRDGREFGHNVTAVWAEAV